LYLKTWAIENDIRDKARKIELQQKMDSIHKEKENKEESQKDYL